MASPRRPKEEGDLCCDAEGGVAICIPPKNESISEFTKCFSKPKSTCPSFRFSRIHVHATKIFRQSGHVEYLDRLISNTKIYADRLNTERTFYPILEWWRFSFDFLMAETFGPSSHSECHHSSPCLNRNAKQQDFHQSD